MGMFFVLSKFINSDITGIAGSGCTTAAGPTIGRSNYTPRITTISPRILVARPRYQKNENHSTQFELAPHKKIPPCGGIFYQFNGAPQCCWIVRSVSIGLINTWGVKITTNTSRVADVSRDPDSAIKSGSPKP